MIRWGICPTLVLRSKSSRGEEVKRLEGVEEAKEEVDMVDLNKR